MGGARRWVWGVTHPESCSARQGVARVGERFLQQVVEVFATLATVARVTLHVHAQGSGLSPGLAVARGHPPIRPLCWLWQVVAPVHRIRVNLRRALRRGERSWRRVDVERDWWACRPRWRDRLIWELRALGGALVFVGALVLVGARWRATTQRAREIDGRTTIRALQRPAQPAPWSRTSKCTLDGRI